MSELQRKELVSRAEFRYCDQEDLVRLIRLIDASDIELSVGFVANTSPRFRELYSKMEGSRENCFTAKLDPDYADCVLKIPRGKHKHLPIDDPMKILPPGIQRFVADLDELIYLSEAEKVVPLLWVMKKENYHAEIERVKVKVPRIDNTDLALNPSEVGHIQGEIEDQIYRPRLRRLASIGALARGFRPNIVTYSEIRRDPATVGEALKVLDTVPGGNHITWLDIGMEPRDEGDREYYSWNCSSRISTSIFRKDAITMLFSKPTDAEEVAHSLQQHGVNLTLVGAG